MASVKKTYKKGEFVFREGDPSLSMYVIQKGTVAVRKKKGSAWIEIARLYEKEVLGELAFFDRRPRSAGAVALTDCELLEIDFDSLDKIYNTVPSYIKTIMSAVAERLRRATDTIKRLQDHAVDPEIAKMPIKEGGSTEGKTDKAEAASETTTKTAAETDPKTDPKKPS